MTPLVITHFSAVNAIGADTGAMFDALTNRASGLAPCTFAEVTLPAFVGEVPGLDRYALTGELADWDCRNQRLARAALESSDFAGKVAAARTRYGADRIAVIMGTSTSGILSTEEAWRRRDPATGALPGDFQYGRTQNLYSLADYVGRALDLTGPSVTISTACSSSAKAFASAARLIEAGLADAAVVGGADSLCRNTLYGFASLDLVSNEPCCPCDAARHGISIGEAAGFALLERPSAASGQTAAGQAVALAGYGESSDAYHMSSPHPEGAGAAAAMRAALARAGIAPQAVDYVNLHGTATLANDSMEDCAVTTVFGPGMKVSSTKGWTGHALGAAGVTEAIIAILCIRHGFLPGTLNCVNIDPAFQSQVLIENRQQRVTTVMSNSFGFGGSNASLILRAWPQ